VHFILKLLTYNAATADADIIINQQHCHKIVI